MGNGKVRRCKLKYKPETPVTTLEMMEETERRREQRRRGEREKHQMILDTVRRETEIRVRREIEEERAIRPEKPDKMWK